MRVLVVLPTYNEAENIALLIPELLALPLDICVVDDASPDGTGRIADDWAAREARVHVVHRAGKLGLGTAYVAGFHFALDRGYDAALTMDADFSHHPRYIPAMLRAIERADLVIGSRYVPGGDVLYPFHRRFLSKAANLIARAALGLKPHDCTAGFRLYRATVLQTVPIDSVFSNGYSFLIEMLNLVQGFGFSIVETPIIFADRTRGQSKISSNEIVRAAYTVSRLTYRRLRDRLIGPPEARRSPHQP
ncbi:MAG: polyprenol monophosphomannose synthase [Anaerolineae bacterium]|nr:polyprenol monophosphomannose synthase [Candidatus Roseilinea sp.]MDW8450435.1 polyprenol monophosphomannose synthase [Anaerolineae bacterium]